MARLTLVSALGLFVPATLMLGACDSEGEQPDDMEAGPLDDKDDDADGDPPPDAPKDDDDDAGDDQGDPPGPPPAPKPDPAVSCDLNHWGGYECTTEDGQEGTNFCIMVDDEELYTPCSTQAPPCEPGEGWDMGCMGEICFWNGESFERYSWEEDDCNTPLVLNFDGSPVEFSPASAASFDLSPDSTCLSTDWPTAPWLALDRDGDGFIRDGGELFGNATKMTAGGYAEHGFAALTELDSNRDGKITAEDERFGELVLWTDLDDDRIGAHAELRPLSETTLVSIDLAFGRRAHCDHQGNCGYERASFEYRTDMGLATGEVVDVHLACR